MQLPENVISNTNVLKVTELPIIPEDFICALSREMFFDPVLADDGFTYEKEEIEQYIATRLSENKKLTSPQTREEISGKLIQNKSMKSQVNSFLTKHPQHWENIYASQSLRHQVLAKLDQANAKDLLALIDRDPRLLTEVFKEKNDKTIIELICSQPSKELLQQTIKKLLPKDKKDIIGFFKGKEVVLFKLLVEHQDVDSIKMMGDILEWSHDFYVAQAYRALEEEDAKSLQTCLRLGVSFKENSNNRPSLIHAAVMKNTSEMLEVICEYSEEALTYREANGNTLLHIAAQANVEEIVQYLLDKDLDPLALNTKQQTPFQVAAYHQSNAVLKLLLSVIDQYELLTQIHSYHGKAEIANVETAFGWDQNFYQRQARKAIIKKDLAILRLCCSMEIPLDAIDKNESEVTLLHLAIATGFEAGAKFLLDAGALITIADEERQTALHYAALYASESLLAVILHKASSGLVMTKSHKLPIQLAIDKNREQPIIELLAKKFKPEEHSQVFNLMSNYHSLEELKKISNTLGWNKAWYFNMACQAIENQNLAELSCCLTLGADITGVNESGDSLLHIAVRCAKDNDTNIITYLLEQGVDGKQVDAKGKRAQELAVSLNKKKLAQFIEKKRREIKLRPFIEPLQEQAKQAELKLAEEQAKQMQFIEPLREQVKQAELKLAEEQAKQMQLKQLLDKTENTLRDQQAFIERQSTALQVLKNVSSLSFRINPLIIKGRNHLIASEENLEIIGLSAGRIVAINEKEEVQLWDGKTKKLIKSYKMIPTLLRTRQKIIQDIVKKAKDNDSGVRGSAIKALGNIKVVTPEIIQELLVAAKDNDSNVRKIAVEVLGELKETTPEIIQALLVAAKDNNSNVRKIAVEVLGELKETTPEIIQVLLSAVKDNDYSVNYSAKRALEKLEVNKPEIIQALLAATKDEDKNLCEVTVKALGKVKEITPEIIQTLLAVAKANLPRLRVYPRQIYYNDSDQNIYRNVINILKKLEVNKPGIIQALIAAIRHENSDIRSSAVQALCNSKEFTLEIIQVLSAAAKDNDSAIRRIAVEGLCKAKEITPEITNALLTAVKDNDSAIRRIAVEGLCKAKEITPEITNALLTAVKDNDSAIRRIAVEGLCKAKEITPEITNALLTAVKDNDSAIRRIAVEGLCKAKEITPEITNALLTAAKDDDRHSSYSYARTDNISIRRIIEQTLNKAKEITPELINDLLNGALNENNQKNSKLCIEILIKLKSDKLNLMDYLIRILKDENNEKNIRCLAIIVSYEMRINNPIMIKTLVEVLKDNDLQIRCLAILALKKMNFHIPELIQEILHISNLIDNVEGEDRDFFKIIIQILIELDIKTPEVLQALINFSNGKDEQIRIEAIVALVILKANTPEVRLIILNLIKNYDQNNKWTIRNLISNLDLSITTMPEVANALLDLIVKDIKCYECLQGNFIEKLNFKISEVISYFLLKLKDNDKSIKCNVLFMLGELKATTPEIVQALLDTFKDHNNDSSNDNGSVRNFVVNTFRKLKDFPITTTKILENLKSEELYDRYIAIHILFLAEINTDEIIKSMLGMIKDNDGFIRKNAIGVLSTSKEATFEIIEALLTAAKDDDSAIRRIAVEGLCKAKEITPEITNALLTAAKDNDSAIRRIAVEVLCKVKEITPEIKQALLAAAKDADSTIRSRAIEALSEIKEPTPEIIQALLAAVKDDEYSIRYKAESALEKLEVNKREIIRVILMALKDNNIRVRISAIKVLGNLKSVLPEIIQALLAAAKDNDSAIRRIAVEVLCKVKEITPEIKQALLAAAKDADSTIRSRAIEALSEIKEPTPEIIQALLAAVKDDDYSICYNAKSALEKLEVNKPEIIQALLVAAKDNDSNVRGSAIKALGNIKVVTPEIIQALLVAAKDNDSNVRGSAIKALGNIKVVTPEIIQALLAAVKDDEYSIRYKAESALEKLEVNKREIIQVILMTLKDNNICVRRSATKALSNLKTVTHEIIQALLAVAKDDDWNVRYEAEIALKKLLVNTSEVMQLLLAELNNKYNFITMQIFINSFKILDEIKNDLQEDYFLIEDALLQRNASRSHIFVNRTY